MRLLDRLKRDKMKEFKEIWCNMKKEEKLVLLMYVIRELDNNPQRVFTREEIDKIVTMINVLDELMGC